MKVVLTTSITKYKNVVLYWVWLCPMGFLFFPRRVQVQDLTWYQMKEKALRSSPQEAPRAEMRKPRWWRRQSFLQNLLLSTACLLLSTACLLLSTAYRLLLSIAYRLPFCYYYRLPACLLLSTTYPHCLQVLPLLLHTHVLLTGLPTHTEYGIAFAIANPCRTWDCLHMLARHVNVYALITPAPGSIPRLSQPPLQKKGRAWSPWWPIRQPTARSPCVHAPG